MLATVIKIGARPLMNQEILANWNGVEMPLASVKVSVLDRAFLFGDSVYEVARIYAGQLFHGRDHLERMSRSLASLQIKGVDMELVLERLQATLAHSKVVEGRAYVQITRGEAPRTHRYPLDARPNILIYVEELEDPFKDFRNTGVACVTHPDIRWQRNDIKSTSLAATCMAAQYAFERGCLDVVFINSAGFVTEGSFTSVFGVKDGKILVAPSTANVLPGITKKLVLELAAACTIPLEETLIRQEEIFLLDEMFMAGTTEEVLAIVRVDDRPIADGEPGPIVRRLQKEYSQLVNAAFLEASGK
jgi:D-alanine transaminase